MKKSALQVGMVGLIFQILLLIITEKHTCHFW